MTKKTVKNTKKDTRESLYEEIEVAITEAMAFDKANEVKQKSKNDRLIKTYGITLADWNAMFIEQGGVCFICKTMPKSKILCVDHIHQKGFKTMEPQDKQKYVRGLLCYMCNTGLKSFEKTVDGKRNRQSLEGTYKYFIKYKLKGE